ncbi:hypothetical protein Patl1_04930 [Pistacia atlantica]|uniref:Uncharacterized protein n=1 Tax=Pistacia atlantica TaxID=434234 RepID=A0ACC1BV08_9ROSI|nr:hypothetical protein Patl1_04930 [Pistacia atlantica]
MTMILHSSLTCKLEELMRYPPLHVSLVDTLLFSVSSSNRINIESLNTQQDPILNQTGVNPSNEVRGIGEHVAPS